MSKRDYRDIHNYLYVCLMEECAEVTQAASKVLRFGEKNYNPADPEKTTNIDKLKYELVDLFAIMAMLKLTIEDTDLVNKLIDAKVDKVNDHYQMMLRRDDYYLKPDPDAGDITYEEAQEWGASTAQWFQETYNPSTNEWIDIIRANKNGQTLYDTEYFGGVSPTQLDLSNVEWSCGNDESRTNEPFGSWNCHEFSGMDGERIDGERPEGDDGEGLLPDSGKMP